MGVFRSTNDGVSWDPFNDGLANVAVVDMALDSAHDILVAGTHGRSVYAIDLAPSPPPEETATPTATDSATPTPTATRTPWEPIAGLRLPLVLSRHARPTPTATVGGSFLATMTPSPTATTGSPA